MSKIVILRPSRKGLRGGYTCNCFGKGPHGDSGYGCASDCHGTCRTRLRGGWDCDCNNPAFGCDKHCEEECGWAGSICTGPCEVACDTECEASCAGNLGNIIAGVIVAFVAVVGVAFVLTCCSEVLVPLAAEAPAAAFPAAAAAPEGGITAEAFAAGVESGEITASNIGMWFEEMSSAAQAALCEGIKSAASALIPGASLIPCP